MISPFEMARRGFLGHFFSPWTWRMARRESRQSRGRLLLFFSPIVLGIAALAAIGSLGRNLESAIAEQSKALLGADLSLSSRDPFTTEQEEWLRGLGGAQSREVVCSSMIYLPRTGNTRLVQVHGLDGGFPYYGELTTEPPGAAGEFRQGGVALVEDSLLQQFDAQIGDSIGVGNLTNRIIGRLQKVPGENVMLSAIAPRVYVSLDDLARAGLLGRGSLANYHAYFKFSPAVDVPKLVERLRPQLEKFRFHAETAEERKRELGSSLDNLYRFLNLVGFIALLLGGVGVASAIHVHIKQKLGTAAVLRCLGCSVAQTFAIYLAQSVALGGMCALAGGALGVAIQTWLPGMLAGFIPFTFHFHPAWSAVGQAVLVGFAICLLFALLPLLEVRRVSPLATLRVSFESEPPRRDPLYWLASAVLAAGVIGFALVQSHNWRIGLGFALGLGFVFGVLALTAKLLMTITRLLARTALPYTVRQGLASLHRPNNRTLPLLLALGLGIFLMLSLYLVQHTLLEQLAIRANQGQANAVLFDIQTSQNEGVARLIRSLNLPVLDETPMVSMRLSSVKGRSVESIMSEHGPGRDRRWIYRREYRSTYSDHLRDGETVVAGAWVGQVTDHPEVTPISLEQDIAKDLAVGIGDELGFDVQGIPIKTRVASLRQVEWRRIQPNFFVVFTRGVLEDAPAMHVLVTHVASSSESARMQREVVKAFPNVSIIDLTLVLQTVDGILAKISFVIRFMAMFTVITGLLVLVSALLTGRYQRIRESVLLRTLGASRSQIFQILLVEYLSLGLLAALAGGLLAVPAAWALAHFIFHLPFVFKLAPLLVTLLAVLLETTFTGFLMGRGITNYPPLAVLRSEA
jgi:putative ABC transport system permease protein